MTNDISFSQAVRLSMTKFHLVNSTNNIKWGDNDLLEQKDLSKLTKAHLKRHLSARNEDTKGSRNILHERLFSSLVRERKIKHEKEVEIERKHRKIACLEEQGAVYCVGSNHRGQLGLGDFHDRSTFTVIPESRGTGIRYVTSRNDLVFGVTVANEVYCWGGGGVGPMGVDRRSDKAKFEIPQKLLNLETEDIIQVAVGANHACAANEYGDLYVWGEGRNGCLGNGQLSNQALPDLIPIFTDNLKVKSCSAGEMHTCALTNNGDVHSFGHTANGRLGLGYFENDKKPNFNIPCQIHFQFNEKIELISCGAEHTLAVGQLRTFSWGSGDGGRLGHGDLIDRWEPTEISSLNGERILDISCGTWHSACIVVVPPMQDDRGWLYTWGTGINGQLGLIDITTSMLPELVISFCNKHILLKSINCGSHHNAAITSELELFTWGSNLNNCLGHKIEEEFVSYTSTPGYCTGFGSIVNRIGRGFPQSVALGRGYTVVATGEYAGPIEIEAKELITKRLKKAHKKKELNGMHTRNKLKELAHSTKRTSKAKEIQFLTSALLCSQCQQNNGCPGKLVNTSYHNISTYGNF
jgi:alpha-tubulin suppressor-like RCC1 family protein